MKQEIRTHIKTMDMEKKRKHIQNNERRKTKTHTKQWQ